MSCPEYQQLLNDIKKIHKQHYIENARARTNKDIKIMIILIILYILLLFIGTLCYVVLFDLDWLSAFYGATLIATGLDIEYDGITTIQRIFIIIFSTLSIITFLALASTIIIRVYDYI